MKPREDRLNYRAHMDAGNGYNEVVAMEAAREGEPGLVQLGTVEYEGRILPVVGFATGQEGEKAYAVVVNDVAQSMTLDDWVVAFGPEPKIAMDRWKEEMAHAGKEYTLVDTTEKTEQE